MKSGPDLPVAVATSPDALPAAAKDLFAQELGYSLAWYRAAVGAAVPLGAEPFFMAVGTPVQAVWPMMRLRHGLASLTSPYTCVWGPLTAPGAALEQAGAVLAAWCREHARVRLDAIDFSDIRWPALLAGIRQGGLTPLRFAHFGNWHANVAGQDWATYLAARPGKLRSTLRRRTERLRDGGAALRLVTEMADLPEAIAAYESVYARSWKGPEPYRDFNPSLMRECAADGSLRLGLLQRGERTLAAQFWVVRGGIATVLKLAHSEAEKAASPGTVLTGLMIRTLLEQDKIAALDFGRGDDVYKRDWTGERRQRDGLVLANPRRLRGFAEVVLNYGRRAIRSR